MSGAQNSSGGARHEALDSCEVQKIISALFPGMVRHWHRPLREYASYVHTIAGATPVSQTRRGARQMLACVVERSALRAGYTSEDAVDARIQLENAPLLQTGPHCHLLTEPDVFYTHHFSILGQANRGRRWHHWYGCSTVKLIESARKGPGWARFGDGAVNVFGLSRRLMDRISVCGRLDDPVRFTLAPAIGAGPDKAQIGAVSPMLPSRAFASAADALRAANVSLWNEWMGDDIRLLQLDDFDIADLVADHLDDPSSWLANHLCEKGGFGTRLLTCLELLDRGPWRGWIRRTTDNFWGLFGGRLLPLRLASGELRSACGKVECRFDNRSIASSLRKRRIVPGLLMTFLVLSILPKARVFGGCRQIIYYPLMRHVVGSAMGQTGCKALWEEIAHDEFPSVWGHRVLTPVDGSPMAEVMSSDIRQRLSSFGDLLLKDACGNMESFAKDPAWAMVRGNVASGAISSLSPELRGGQMS